MAVHIPNRTPMFRQVFSLKESASPRAFQCVGKGSGMVSQTIYTARNPKAPVARINHTHFHGGLRSFGLSGSRENTMFLTIPSHSRPFGASMATKTFRR